LSISNSPSSAWKLFTPTGVVGAGVHLGQLASPAWTSAMVALSKANS
jgi:hypothetical protein